MLLDTSLQNFRKNLYSCGVTASVTDFEGLVSFLQTKVVSDVIKAMSSDSPKNGLEKIFGLNSTKPSLSCIYDKEEIHFVSNEYFLNLYNHGVLDVFFKEEKNTFKNKHHETAFKYHLLTKVCSNRPYEVNAGVRFFLFYIKRHTNFFSYIIAKHPTFFIQARFDADNSVLLKSKLIPFDEIQLSSDEKTEIINSLFSIFDDFKNLINKEDNPYKRVITSYHLKQIEEFFLTDISTLIWGFLSLIIIVIHFNFLHKRI